MPTRYHPALVALHWLLALMIIVLLAAGTLLLDPTPNSDPLKLDGLRSHMILGLSVGALMLVRLVVRLRTRHPAPATTGIALADRLAPLAHWALYAAVLGMVGSGMALSFASGLPDAAFGTGALPETFDTFAPRAVHGFFATLLMALIALHIAAALYHAVVKRDGLMRRMGFGKR